MGHRLSKIVTRTGDDGSTGLADGTRVPKDAPRVEALGSVDELNCALGWLLAVAAQQGAAGPAEAPGAAQQQLTDATACLTRIQHDLFDLGGALALPGAPGITAARVAWLETQVERFNSGLPALREFVLPGGGCAAAAAHLARAVCRRAERRCWALARSEPLPPASLQYLNRLSDLLFVLARIYARSRGDPELMWAHGPPEAPGR